MGLSDALGALKSKRVQVKVSVDLDDVRNVVAYEAGKPCDPHTYRWLAFYAEAEGEKKSHIFQSMTPSLQWCVHTLATKGVDALKVLLPVTKDGDDE